MRKMYKGYEIRRYERMGVGHGVYFEIWKDGTMWGFTSDYDDAEIMIDRMEA